MRALWLTGAFVTATVLAACPAHALIQTVSPIGGVGFSTSGPNVNNTNIQFPPFSASVPSNLLGARIKLLNSFFTGSYDLLAINTGTVSISSTVSAVPKFTFTGSVGASTGSSQSLAPNPRVTNCPTLVIPGVIELCSDTVAINPASQLYAQAFAQLAAATPALQSYFTGTPTIDFSETLYTKTQTPLSPSLAFDPAKLNFAGDIVLEYEYVPGPLPLLGAGAAFGWTRRLRRRISNSAKV
jgi:hypothetical protein